MYTLADGQCVQEKGKECGKRKDMEYKINRENGITNRGNLTRLKKLMKRAQKGETITLGFLGGSITQGVWQVSQICATLIVCILGGARRFHNQNLYISMRESEEPIRSLVWLVSRMICLVPIRIL